mgnify:CR=1 FL=1
MKQMSGDVDPEGKFLIANLIFNFNDHLEEL